MPKKTGTRKHVAAGLYSRLKSGPLSFGIDGSMRMRAGDLGLDNLPELTPAQRETVIALIRQNYSLWAQTWLVPDIARLCPEVAALLAVDIAERGGKQLAEANHLHNPK